MEPDFFTIWAQFYTRQANRLMGCGLDWELSALNHYAKQLTRRYFSMYYKD